MKTRILRKLLSLIPAKDRNWKFEAYNTGLRLYAPYYGITKATEDWHACTPIKVEIDGKAGNITAAYIAQVSPERVEALLDERDILLAVTKTARQMVNQFLWNVDPETGVIQATHVNYAKWNELLSRLCKAIDKAEGD